MLHFDLNVTVTICQASQDVVSQVDSLSNSKVKFSDILELLCSILTVIVTICQAARM